MHVFVTGAAGFIGQATTRELLSHGHSVLGLVRTDAQASTLISLGAEPHRGTLEDTESLKSGAAKCDGIIHLAFIFDMTNFPHAAAVDRAAIAAMGEVFSGSGKPFVIVSGTLATPKNGILATEDTEPERESPLSVRSLSGDLIFKLAREENIRGMVIRLCPTVHGAGDKGFIPQLADAGRKSGSLVYIGDGSTRWPAVHREDAAVMLRLALEKGRAGATYNAVADQAVSIKEIMTVVGKRMDLPVESKTVEEAGASIGFFAHVISMDNPTSGEKTQRELGWTPTGPGLLEDLEKNYEF